MKIFSFLTFLFVSACCFSQTTTLPPNVVASIQQRIDEQMNPGIVVGIIDVDGTHYYSFGLTKKGGAKVDEHSIYEIGSISKVFTATLLADMALKGDVRIDDPIEKYLPAHLNLPTYGETSITLGNLSDHTSSLPRMPDNFTPADPGNPYADYTVQQMYAFLESCTLKEPIGSTYEYSNLGVGLLGHILAREAGTSYEELLSTTITGPLKMKETKVTLDKVMKKNLAYGHYQGNEVPNWDLPTFAGAGGIRSSIHDMLIFLAAEMELNDFPLKEAMLLTHKPRHDKAGGTRLGLGWHISDGSNGDIIWHNGATGGYTAFAGFVKETGTGVAVLTNSNEAVDDIGFHLLDPDSPLRPLMPHISLKLKEIIDTDGPGDLIMKYDSLKKQFSSKYAYEEQGINDLGYYYLNRKQFKEAQAIFLLNIREFPKSANVYDSYAESLMEDGQKDLAIIHYKKSLELNPANINAVEMLAKMGVTAELPEVHVDDLILEKYTGIYELVPGFELVITREGNQLKGQATGQATYEIYPKSDSEFYYKVVDAQIIFNLNQAGKVESLTLHQGGRDMEGKKIK